MYTHTPEYKNMWLVLFSLIQQEQIIIIYSILCYTIQKKKFFFLHFHFLRMCSKKMSWERRFALPGDSIFQENKDSSPFFYRCCCFGVYKNCLIPPPRVKMIRLIISRFQRFLASAFAKKKRERKEKTYSIIPRNKARLLA